MAMKKSQVPYCGVYCGACSLRLGGTDEHHLTSRAKAMDPKEKEYWTSCPGCRTGDHRADCDFRICAMAKRLEHCVDCVDFPCGMHKEFNSDGVPHHAGSLASLAFLKEYGAEAWFRMQDGKWTCGCGAGLSWYLERCLGCGVEGR